LAKVAGAGSITLTGRLPSLHTTRGLSSGYGGRHRSANPKPQAEQCAFEHCVV